MAILDIYKKYKIMPQLQEHQLRVAGVAFLVCESFEGDINKQDIVTACLLHDMGNIIKFDLSQANNYVNQDIDSAYWTGVQEEFKKKYGDNEHQAHMEIAREIGASDRIIDLIGCIRFLEAPTTAAGQDFGKKIVQYSDDRVGPKGVISLEGRFADLRERYKKHGENSPERDNFENALREIERQIFAYCKIVPADITPESVNKKIEQLKNYQIG